MFTRSDLTLRLCALLRSANGLISWATLETETGRSRADLRAPVAAARRYLDVEEGIVFRTLRGEGFERMDDRDKLADTERLRRGIYRTAHKGTHRLGTISDLSAMSPADQLRASLNATIFHAVRETAGTQEDDALPAH